MTIPKEIDNLIKRLSELPSIGPRQATRLVFYLINKGQNDIKNLVEAIDELGKIKICEHCFFVHQNESNLCDICVDKNRHHSIIAVLEKETDLISIENTHRFSGRYLIIGNLSKTGIIENWQKLRLKELQNQIKKELGGKAKEIILAFNPTSNGNMVASLIAKELEPYSEKLTRLGRGLPTGGEIEFADDETLGEALNNRS